MIQYIINVERRRPMTLTRPRLMALSLCTLLALLVLWFAWSSNRASRHLRQVYNPPMLIESSPPPNFAPADSAPVRLPAIDASGEAGRAAGPNVGPTAAPGVAFSYRYAFRLGAARIAQVQERHAAMCERLTVARCRITGMLYRVAGERDIEAMLALKVDPAGARHFGREAAGVVVQAEGMLTESEIGGTDAGAAIQAAGRNLAELEAELARLEARLRRSTAGERAARQARRASPSRRWCSATVRATSSPASRRARRSASRSKMPVNRSWAAPTSCSGS